MKFNKILILTMLLILLTSFASALTPPSGGVQYFNLSSFTDLWGITDGINSGSTSQTTYPTFNKTGDSSPSSSYFSTSSAYIDTGKQFGTGDDYTISLWYRQPSSSQNGQIWGQNDASDWWPSLKVGVNNVYFYMTNSVYVGPVSSVNDDAWHHYVSIKNGTTIELYFDGVSVGTSSGTVTVASANVELGGRSSAGGDDINGYIDVYKLYNRPLTQLEVVNLYNCNDINSCDIQANNFTVTAISNYSDITINNFSVNIDGVDYNTTTGSIITHILDNSTELYNITLTSNEWFNKTYPYYNVSSNLEASLIQSELSFACYEKVSGNSLTCDNSTIINPDAGVYNWTLGVTDYYNILYNTIITPLQNETLQVNNFYSTNLTFNPIFVTGPGAGTCNYTVQGITSPGFSETVNANYTGLINGSYNVTVDCENYAYSHESILINEVEETLNFSLYTSNSIDITIYDETSGALINGTNITVTKTLGSTQTQNITSSGSISYQYLTAGNYTFSFEGSNYPKRTYSVQIGNKTYQTLKVYLLQNSTDAVIFTFLEYQSNEVIEDTTLQISTVINGSDTLIAVLTSDITGKTQFYFDTTSKYCFVASKTNYQTKSFCLDPIIFNTYTIRLETSVELSTGNAFEEVLVDYTPKSYWNNQNNTITFTFANPEGSLTSYGFNATYNGSTVSASGSNAYGEVITTDLEILGAEYGDKVIVHYYYKKSGDDDYKTQKLIYEILGYDSASDSIQDNPPGDYGLGIFVSTLISVIIVLLVSGLASFFGGVVAGGLMALLMFAWLMKIDFLNFWAGIISVIILFVVVSWRSNQ